jgi:hypothetical protein
MMRTRSEFRAAATEYIDAQLETMRQHGPPPNVTPEHRVRMIDRAERLVIDAQPPKIRRALLREIRTERSLENR